MAKCAPEPSPAPPRRDAAPSAPVHAGGGGGLRHELLQMSYDEGAARLAPGDDGGGGAGMFGEAGTVGGTTDPRLKYTKKGRDEQQGLDPQRLPYKDPKKPELGWNHQEILSQLTQVDSTDETTTDEVRCGANAALAIAVMNGPGAVDRLSKGLDRVYLDTMYPRQGAKPTGEKKEQLQSAYMDSGVACFRITQGFGTYADLSQIADAMAILMAPNVFKTGTNGHEAQAMAGLFADTEKRGTPMQDREHIATYAQALKPGEAYLMNVDTDVHTGGQLGPDLGNHCIVLGREPKVEGQKSRVFLYDPYPREGTQYMYSDDPDFWTIFESKDGKPKATYITSKVSAAQYARPAA